MPNRKAKWNDKLVGPWSTRHMPYVLQAQLKKLAAKMETSVEIVANMVVEEGLKTVERKYREEGF